MGCGLSYLTICYFICCLQYFNAYFVPKSLFKSQNNIKLHSQKNDKNHNEITLSNLVNGISVSKTIEIHALTKEMEAKGETVYSLCVGEPDYQPPIEVINATINAVKQGKTKYKTAYKSL